MNILELFSGTESFSKVCREYGDQCITIDKDNRFKPTYCIDLSNGLDISNKFDIIWASPPCQCFSVASIGKHWGGGYRQYIPKTDDARNSIKLLYKTAEIIRNINPRYWFIENPRGVMRKILPKILDEYGLSYERKTITYCQYGDSRMKPTDIFTNLVDWKPKPMCHNGDKCHIEARRGYKTGTQGLKGSIERSIIPYDLCNEIRQVIGDGIVREKKQGGV